MPDNLNRVPIMAAKQQISERDEALAHLRTFLKPGDTVYSTLRHVSRSGMQREISFHIIRDNEPLWLDYWIAKACDYRRGKREGLIVTGCGMDMGFAVVYHLGAVLWPSGTPTPHGTRNGEPDSDGGYALKQRWM